MLAIGASAQTHNDVIDKYNEAAELMGGKKFAEAIPVLTEGINIGLEVGGESSDLVSQMQKFLPTCYFRVGVAAAQAGDYPAAIENSQKAAELAELYGDAKIMNNAKIMIGKAYTAYGADAFNSGDFAKAVEIFSKGYEANPNDTDLAMYLANSYRGLKEYDKALEVYQGVIDLEARHSKYQEPAAKAREAAIETLLEVASGQVAEKQNDEAIATLERALAIDPASPIANLMLVQIATNMQNWAKVIECGDAAAEAQTDDAAKSNAYFLLGAAYQNTENKAKAIETYRKVTAGDNVAEAKKQIGLLNK